MFLACSFLQKKLYILLDNLELCTKKASEAFSKGNFINLVNVSNNLQTNTIIYTSFPISIRYIKYIVLFCAFCYKRVYVKVFKGNIHPNITNTKLLLIKNRFSLAKVKFYQVSFAWETKITYLLELSSFIPVFISEDFDAAKEILSKMKYYDNISKQIREKMMG